MTLNNIPPPQAQAEADSLWHDYQLQCFNRLRRPQIAPTIHFIGACSLDVTTKLRDKGEAVRAMLLLKPRS